MLRERGAPLAGDSSRSIREESLLANGVALSWDYCTVSVDSWTRTQVEEGKARTRLLIMLFTYRRLAPDAR